MDRIQFKSSAWAVGTKVSFKAQDSLPGFPLQLAEIARHSLPFVLSVSSSPFFFRWSWIKRFGDLGHVQCSMGACPCWKGIRCTRQRRRLKLVSLNFPSRPSSISLSRLLLLSFALLFLTLSHLFWCSSFLAYLHKRRVGLPSHKFPHLLHHPKTSPRVVPAGCRIG